MSASEHFDGGVRSLGSQREPKIPLDFGAALQSELDARVQQRTFELAQANASLLAEIVERKRMEEALRHAEEKYRSIVENAIEGLYQVAPDGRFLSVNPALAQMYGFNSPLQLLEESPYFRSTNSLKPEFHHEFKQLADKPEGIRAWQYQVQRRDGSVVWISENARAVRDKNGLVLHYDGTVQEITEAKRSEAALRESEEKYRAFVETTSEWIWAVTNEGHLTYTNPAIQPILGYAAHEVMGQNSFDLLLPEDRHQLDAMLPIFIADKWGWKDLAFRWRHKDGSFRYLESNASPILDSAGDVIGYRGTSRDITERKRVEQALADERALLTERVAERTAELSTANAELAKAARLKDEFLASMSHELRTPLNAVLGLSEVLQEQVYGPLNEKQLRSLNSIEESGRHLLSLINDILDLSKIEAGKVQLDIGDVNVESVCQASLRLVKEAAQKKRLRLSSACDSSIVQVRADERRLKQILVNLLSNAVKFTHEQGTIGLEVTRHPEQPAVCFTVWDTGIGISEDDLLKLFQPFIQLDSRLSRQYAGTGLGLALVRRMAEMHGGSVSIQSEVGKGSRFTVSLPWEESTPEPVKTTRSQGDTASSETRLFHRDPTLATDQPLILLVEDNEMNIESMSVYLQAKGFRVAVAREGGEAIQRVQETRPALILMDIQMPGMDGLEATRRLKADPATAAVPIIALTALAMPGDRERCLAAGANDYFSKPANLSRLINTIFAFLKK